MSCNYWLLALLVASVKAEEYLFADHEVFKVNDYNELFIEGTSNDRYSINVLVLLEIMPLLKSLSQTD